MRCNPFSAAFATATITMNQLAETTPVTCPTLLLCIGAPWSPISFRGMIGQHMLKMYRGHGFSNVKFCLFSFIVAWVILIFSLDWSQPFAYNDNICYLPHGIHASIKCHYLWVSGLTESLNGHERQASVINFPQNHSRLQLRRLCYSWHNNLLKEGPASPC